MARTPDLQKWEKAWAHLSTGGSLEATGLNKQVAIGLRKLINAGWTWPYVYKRIAGDGVSIGDVVAEIDKPLPKESKAPKTPKEAKAEAAAVKAVELDEAEIITPADLARIVESTPPPIMTAAQRRQIQLVRQRAHQESEIKSADRLNDFAIRLLDNASPYIIPKRKVSRREANCPHCAKPVTVEEIHIHPAKIDVGSIAKLFKEASERKRVALGMPKQHLSVRISDVYSEVSDRLRDVDEAFKAAFQHGIEHGLISEQGAHEIWERARAQIEGKHA